MTTADALSWALTILGFMNFVTYAIGAVRCKELRGLNILIAIASIWLAIFFGLNSLHLVINVAGLSGGRPPTISLLAALLGRGIYTFRNRGC